MEGLGELVKERGRREPIRVCACVCVCLPVCLLSPTLWHVWCLPWKQTSVCVLVGEVSE